MPVAPAQDVKSLTDQELNQRIEALDPSKTDPLKLAPASVAVPKMRTAADAAAKLVNSTPAPPMRADSSDKPNKVEKKAKGPTVIEALQSTFEQKAHLAIFIGEVVVEDPEFNVQCDKLTAFLKHEEKLTNIAPRLSPATPAPDKADLKVGGAGGLEKAIAEADPGRVVVIRQEKKEVDGSISKSIGRARRAEYVAATGDITLTGKPEVQQAINTCVATDDSTVIVLNRDGRMRVNGPHKIVIKDQGDLTK